MSPLVITAAINGGGPPKAKTPHQPVTPRAIVEEALAAWREGAAMIHLHGRTEDGETSSDPRLHADILAAIRAAGCDAILNISAGDDGGKASHAERLALIEAGAELVSLTASSYNSGARLYDNRPGYLREALARMRAAGVRPEIEIIDTGFLDRLAGLVAYGLIDPPPYCLFAFGLSGGMPADLRLLPVLTERLPARAQWGVACQLADPGRCNAFFEAALAGGGHVRVGLEDCPYRADGALAQGNAELVAALRAKADALSRPVASPAAARRLLGLAEAPSPAQSLP